MNRPALASPFSLSFALSLALAACASNPPPAAATAQAGNAKPWAYSGNPTSDDVTGVTRVLDDHDADPKNVQIVEFESPCALKNLEGEGMCARALIGPPHSDQVEEFDMVKRGGKWMEAD
jgi:hypothetical protein